MKFKPLFFFALTFGLLTAAFGQNSRVDGVVQTRYGTPAPGALVAVCSQPASTGTTPCTPLANLCSSRTDNTCQSPNPVTADGLGNYFFYAAPGTYTLQFYGPSLTTKILPDQGLVVAQLAASNSSTVVFSATPTFTVQATSQLFQMTLTGNVTSATLGVASGLSPPAYITWEWTQDAVGGRTVVYPANVLGGDQVSTAPNAITSQTFFWDGTNAFAVSSSRISGVSPAATTLPGEMRMYGGSSAPSGWLLCQGQAVSRTQYASLFAIIGTTFGAGDGSTTFNLPDLRGRAAIGSGQGTGLTNRVLGAFGGEETHVLSLAEIPAHNHSAGTLAPSWSAGDVPATFQGVANAASGGAIFGAGVRDTLTITGSTGNAGSGGAHNNMQPYLVLNYIIKY